MSEIEIKILPLGDDLIVQLVDGKGSKFKGIITSFDEDNGVWE